MKRSVVGMAALLVAVGLAGCANQPEPQPTPSVSSPAATPTNPPTTGSTATATPTGAVSTWGSQPLEVTHNVPVPPVPQLIGIRAAHHTEGYDRITFDFTSTLPGYSVRYVDKVLGDASGQPVSLPGRRFLQIVFRPAQAHDDSGTALTPRTRTLNLPSLEAYVINGDFEAVLTVSLGLQDVVGFRVGELPGTPGRIYLDVAA